MPELLTKYPDVALKILKEAGVNCGRGARQQILTTCPENIFCQLPAGELCIYGIKDLPRMTQISMADFSIYKTPQLGFNTFISSLVICFVLGLVLGIFLSKRPPKD